MNARKNKGPSIEPSRIPPVIDNSQEDNFQFWLVALGSAGKKSNF